MFKIVCMYLDTRVKIQRIAYYAVLNVYVRIFAMASATQSFFEQITKSKQTNKYTYQLLMRKNPEMKSEQKWIEQFGNEGLNWNKIYTNRLQAIKDIRLQNFQYKCLMRIIPTNKYL